LGLAAHASELDGESAKENLKKQCMVEHFVERTHRRTTAHECTNPMGSWSSVYRDEQDSEGRTLGERLSGAACLFILLVAPSDGDIGCVIEQCLDEHDMQLPLVVRTVGDNGSVLVAGFDEGAELVALTKHCENDTFTLPIKITIVSQNNRNARFVIECDGNIGRVH